MSTNGLQLIWMFTINLVVLLNSVQILMINRRKR